MHRRIQRKALSLLVILNLTFVACHKNSEPEKSLNEYRMNLKSFWSSFGGSRKMPDVDFFLFGMGNRSKLLYKKGILINAVKGDTIGKWNVAREVILTPDYSVWLLTTDGKQVTISEDENAVWISGNNKKTFITGTESHVNLPDFREYKYDQVLKVLHQEILVNIIDGKPVPNYFVYRNPWRRDGAMVAMCLKETGNTGLIKDWVLSLTDPYDWNNGGNTEADNLGQTLYLLSLFTGKNHPLVPEILQEAKKIEAADSAGTYIKGITDAHEVPAYQTKWLKYGLKSLYLPDKYIIPQVSDDYSALFWMDFKESYLPGTNDSDDKEKYPYLGWACDHFHGTRTSPVSGRDYPLTWETDASQADYDGMKIIDEKYVSARTSSPHTWHSAEVFLYLLEFKKQGNQNKGISSK